MKKKSILRAGLNSKLRWGGGLAGVRLESYVFKAQSPARGEGEGDSLGWLNYQVFCFTFISKTIFLQFSNFIF